jgi:alkylhydroperoxidase family enzyme
MITSGSPKSGDEMPRIAPLDVEATTGEARKALEMLPFKLNIFRTIAHAPTNIAAVLQLASAILFRQELGDRERELITLLVSKLAGGEYEWKLHLGIAKDVGVTDAEIAAIESGDHERFPQELRALLAFSAQVSQVIRVPSAVFDAVRQYYSDREIVEAIIVVGFYQMMARITETLEVEVDDAQVSMSAAARVSAALGS